MPASSNFLMAKGKNASAAITKKRFVKLDTTDTTGETVKQCDTAGERVFGVAFIGATTTEISKGKGVPVLTEGRAIVEAGAALTVGQEVMTDASGRAVLATTGLYIVGVCDEPASGVGAECSVALSAFSHAKV